MAFRSERINVTDEPTEVFASDADDSNLGKSVTIRNRSEVALDVGGPDVAAGAGYELEPDDEISLDMEAGEPIYLVAADPGPHRIDVLWGGVAS